MDSRIFPRQKPTLLDSKSDLFGDPSIVYNYSQKLDLIIKPRVSNEQYVELDVPATTTLFTSPEMLLYLRFQITDLKGGAYPTG